MEERDGENSPSCLPEGCRHVVYPLPGDDGNEQDDADGKAAVRGAGTEEPTEQRRRSRRQRRIPLRIGIGIHDSSMPRTRPTYRRAAFARREPTSQIGPGSRCAAART